MDERQVEQILQNPKFKEMVARKSRLSWILTAIMLFVYVGFMLLVGYNKEFLMTSFSWWRDDDWYATWFKHHRIIIFTLRRVFLYCE